MGRLEFGLRSLAIIVVLITPIFFDAFWMLLLLKFVIQIPLGACITVRRLHDLGFSGWWYLLMWPPLIDLICNIFLVLWPGDKKDTKYGPALVEQDDRSMMVKRAERDPWQKLSERDKLITDKPTEPVKTAEPTEKPQQEPWRGPDTG